MISIYLQEWNLQLVYLLNVTFHYMLDCLCVWFDLAESVCDVKPLDYNLANTYL